MVKHWILADRSERLRAANLGEYGDMAGELRWVTEKEAFDAELLRGELQAGFQESVDWWFSQTKPAFGPLSPGCRICGNGGWSCLFINGKCNCRCFYCPTTQNEISVPTTNRLFFDKAEDYSAYVNHFGFEGVSISGGEPLLTPEKTVRYIDTVRKQCGDGIHIWMYTNGTLLTVEHVKALKDAGLNELRFDISARDYSLDALKLAVGHIPVITVEIPAIPEDIDTLKGLIPRLHDEGVSHLNLHQMRLTPHNSRFLKSRNYTFLHGEKVTVLESELTALTLLKEATVGGWELPINYCSFTYKNQFQGAASRRRSARSIAKEFESVTESGRIRTLIVSGPSDIMQANVERLSAHDPDKKKWQVSGDQSQITVHPDLWPVIDANDATLTLKYADAIMSPALSYHHPFKDVRLSTGRKIYVEKRNRKALALDKDQTAFFEQRVLSGQILPGEEKDPGFLDEEFIRPGLQTYF
jgi:uncharacterized protein